MTLQQGEAVHRERLIGRRPREITERHRRPALAFRRQHALRELLEETDPVHIRGLRTIPKVAASILARPNRGHIHVAD